MFGCLRRLLGIAIIAVIAIAAWHYRDRWWPGARAGAGAGADSTAAAGITQPAEWEQVTDEGATRARTAIESLGRPSGPVFANLTAGDLLSYAFLSLSKQLPASASDVRAAVVNDRLVLRATIALDDIKAVEALGPFAGFLGSRETLQLGGTVNVVRPGLAQFRVDEVAIRELEIPRRAIPKLLELVTRGERPEGIAADALPITIPEYIGDARVGRGRITLYKAVP
jgi:hypothetical protein